MAIAFCATAQAFHQCLAQLPPAASYATYVCQGDALDFTSLQECTTVVLEATSTSSPAYHVSLEKAVSMLSNQGKCVILSPSIVANMVLALSGLAASTGVEPVHYVGSLCNSCDVAPLLQAAELRLLLLDGNVYAWYIPEQQHLRLEGAGCAVIFTKNAAAGTAPAAVKIDVLTAGSGQHW
jgi:hypothetical protein